MRAILISHSPDSMATLRRRLASLVADVEVTEHDPGQRGKPGPGFNWALYDVLFIDERLGGAESGLAWLALFALDQPLPPAVLVAEVLDEFVSARVAEMTATAYVRREDLAGASLQRVLGELGVSLTARPRPHSLAHMVFNGDREIMRRLALGGGDDGYKFVRLIGQSALSRVYLADRLADGQTLVLKVLDLDAIGDDAAVQRFAREAALLASIDSPYVIKFHDHGFTPTFGYIAVEFFARGDLKRRIEQGLRPQDALICARDIAHGLEAIHAQGIVHRDLKPGNIMFRGDDSLALADFDLSKHVDDSLDLTRTGAVIGTLNYLSPEQGLGRAVDQRTDLYALGMVLFEMLTGRTAFQASSPGALVYQHLHADVPPLPDDFARYQGVVTKLLAKDPNDRYASARELIVELTPLCA